jgi:hypothetical protein
VSTSPVRTQKTQTLINSCSANTKDALYRIELASESYLEHLEKSREVANQRAIQGGLQFHDMTERYQDISEAADNTFEWILQDTSGSEQLSSNRELILPFKAWLETGSGIFHISGKPGSGKSTLMKFLCNHARTKSSLESWAGEKKLIIGHFFFWNRGSRMQKSLLGLIRALTFHVTNQCPHIIPEIFPQHWEPARYEPVGQHPVVNIENDEIIWAFRQLVTIKDIYENYRYCFFIDGLDEFDEMLQTYTNLINAIWSWVESSQGHLKICVSSRELPPFQLRFDAKQRLRLQDLTKADIAGLVQQGLQQEQDFLDKTFADTESFKRLQAAITTKADGVFLWVVLTLKTIREALQSRESMSDVLRILDTVPEQLEEFFRYILDSISIVHRKKAAFVFAFALGIEVLPISFFNCVVYGPSLLRYSFLDELADDPHFLMRENAPSSTELIEDRIASCRIRISGRCKGLLEFRPYGNQNQEMIKFTHRSIPEFLENYLSSHWNKYLSEFDLMHAYTSTLIAALRLMPMDFSISTANRLLMELLCALVVLRNTQKCGNTDSFTCLDDVEKILYEKQVEISPEFPTLTWTRFYTLDAGTPAFVSIFHTALSTHCHEYVAWRIRNDPEVVATSNAAQALHDIFNGIHSQHLPPWDLFPRSTPNDVFLTTVALLKQGVNPNCISIRPKDEGLSAWGKLITKLTQCKMEELAQYWAAVEAILQFGGSLPLWSRDSVESITISMPEMHRSIVVVEKLDMKGSLPEALKHMGGTATLEDFVSFHAPENCERILQLLEAR